MARDVSDHIGDLVEEPFQWCSVGEEEEEGQLTPFLQRMMIVDADVEAKDYTPLKV